jgi:RND family efflux transporter MFP subunit
MTAISGEENENPTVPHTEQTIVSPQQPKQTPNLRERKSPRRFLLPALIVLALLGGIGWVVFNRVIVPILAFSQMKPQPTKVQLASPKTATIEDTSDYPASLDSRQSVTVQPRVPGQISQIFVKAGDRVQAGQTLLQIDSAEQRATVASRTAAANTAAAEVDSARADVVNSIDNLRSLEAKRAAAQSNVQLAQREYQRFLELVNQGAEARQLLDQRLNALQTAQASLRQAEADIRAQQASINRARSTVSRNQRAVDQAQANISESQAQLKYYTITAPFSGVVGDIPAKEGDVVSNTTPLLTLTQNDALEVQIQVPLERSSSLRTGLPVRLLNDRDQVLKTGRISSIAPNVDPTTQTVLTKAQFDNASNALRTSQFVRTRVIWSNRPGVLVPTTAISRLAGKDFVFVAAPFQASGCEAVAQGASGGPPVQAGPNDLVAAQRPLKLGKIIGNEQEVIDGLKPGDRIVTVGILQLQNCTAIAE